MLYQQEKQNFVKFYTKFKKINKLVENLLDYRKNIGNWKVSFGVSIFNTNLKIFVLNETKQIFVYLAAIIVFILILIKLYKIKNKRFDTQN